VGVVGKNRGLKTVSGAEVLILYELNKREPNALGISIFSIPVEENIVPPGLLNEALERMTKEEFVEFNESLKKYQLTPEGKSACERWIRSFLRAKHRIPRSKR